MEFLKKNTRIILVLLVTFFAYSNILDNQFILDDESFVVEWSQPKNLSVNLGKLIQGDLPTRQEGVYRPLRSLMYSFSYKIWQVDPRGFHIQSIITHLAVTFIIYLISQKILKDNISAAVSSLIFGLHPIHVEAVSWITASMDTIGIFLFFISFYFYLVKKETGSIVFKYSSILIFIASAFYYELTLTLPLIIFAYEYFIEGSSVKKSFINSIEYLLIVGFYALVRFGIIHTPQRARYILNNPIQTWIVMTIAVIKYIELLLVPVNLQYNHSIYGRIRGLFHFEYHSSQAYDFPQFSSPEFLTSAAILVFLLVLIFKLRRNKPIFSFAISFVLLSLLPVIQIIPTSGIFSERYLYPGSFGVAIIFGYIFYTFYKSEKKWIKNIFTVITFALLLFYFQATQTRNTYWNNPIRFWTHEFKYSPDSSYVHSELATAYSKIGDNKKSKEYIQNAIKYNPGSPVNLSNLAYLFLIEGDYQQAIKHYQKAIDIRPNLLGAHIGKAEALKKQDKKDEAVVVYQYLIDNHPDYIEAYINLSSVFLKTDTGKALDLIIKAKKIAPHRSEIYKALGYIYLEKDEIKKAKENFSTYLRSNPKDREEIIGLF